MIGWRFTDFIPDEKGSLFDNLLKLFKELLLFTSGEVVEALSWLTQIDQEHGLTNEKYGMADFIQELIDKGFIQNPDGQSGFRPSKKMELHLRQAALEEVFGHMRKGLRGRHDTPKSGRGNEATANLRNYQYGDRLEHLALSESMRNAQIHHGIDDFRLTEDDLVVRDQYFQSQMSTVLMIDISHSMILYGEDRITPAKKVAMALSELITTRYPKDTLDILVFGNDARQIEIKELPYLQVGPYHTNTVAGLELAIDLLSRRRNLNKQIFMITDGKPSCIKKGSRYYKNSFGLDKQIVNRTLSMAHRCRKLDIPITTFMIAQDPYLVEFVQSFTAVNGGKAFYTGLEGLGNIVFMDYKNNKRKRF